MKKLIFVLIVLLITSCKKEEINNVTFPEVGLYGDNLLNNQTEYYAECDLSLAAKLEGDVKLEIVITYLDGSIWETSYTNNTDIDRITIDNTQKFTSIHSNDIFDTWIIVYHDSHYKIDYYINDKLVKSKNITVYSDGCYNP